MAKSKYRAGPGLGMTPYTRKNAAWNAVRLTNALKTYYRLPRRGVRKNTKKPCPPNKFKFKFQIKKGKNFQCYDAGPSSAAASSVYWALPSRKALRAKEKIAGNLCYVHNVTQGALQGGAGKQLVNNMSYYMDNTGSSSMIQAIATTYAPNAFPSGKIGQGSSGGARTWQYYLKSVNGTLDFTNSSNMVTYVDVFFVSAARDQTTGSHFADPSSCWQYGLSEQTGNSYTANEFTQVGQTPGTVPAFRRYWRVRRCRKLIMSPASAHRVTYNIKVNRRIDQDLLNTNTVIKDLTTFVMIVARTMPIRDLTDTPHATTVGPVALNYVDTQTYKYYNVVSGEQHADTVVGTLTTTASKFVGLNNLTDVSVVEDV